MHLLDWMDASLTGYSSARCAARDLAGRSGQKGAYERCMVVAGRGSCRDADRGCFTYYVALPWVWFAVSGRLRRLSCATVPVAQRRAFCENRDSCTKDRVAPVSVSKDQSYKKVKLCIEEVQSDAPYVAVFGRWVLPTIPPGALQASSLVGTAEHQGLRWQRQ